MAAFRWRSLETYSPFAQVLATFMWNQRPPLHPTQLADLTGIPYLTIYRWFMNNSVPDPRHVLQLAQRTPLSVQALFLAAGYGSEDFPLFTLADVWQFVREQILASVDVGLEERDTALRVLQIASEIKVTIDADEAAVLSD